MTPGRKPKPMKPPFGGIFYLRSRYGGSSREPSAIDRLAAVGDPTGATAGRVEEWDAHDRQLRELVAESVRRSLG